MVSSFLKGIIAASLILIVLYFFGILRYEGLDNVDTGLPPVAEITPDVPTDAEAQNFIDSTEEIDISEDLLITGNNIAINSVSTSKKNPNLQLRSDPPITERDTGAWQNSTIIPDYSNKVLGI